MHKTANLILWLTVIGWLFVWSYWMFGGREWLEIGQAVAIFGFALTLLILKPKLKISKIAFAIATNQLIDELFFNPYTITWQEYLTAFLVILLIFTNTSLNKLVSKIITIFTK